MRAYMVINKAILNSIALMAITICGWWFLSPATPPAEPETAVNTTANPDFLAVSPEKTRLIGITVTAASPAAEVPLAQLPATISPPPNARVAVAATLPGTVQRTFVSEGDMVRAGQPLAVIVSRDILTIGADLSRANARLGVSQASAARLSKLSREGIIAVSRADEAQALAAEARADVFEKSRILRMVGGSGASGTYTLSAPISGRVTTANITAGNPVDGMTAPYVIDAQGKYEVIAQVPENLIGTLRPGMSVRLGELSGNVTSIGSTIDPLTRSATLRASIPSGPGILAGRNATITVFGPAPAKAVTVPVPALASIDGRDVVFVATSDGYSRRAVKAATADEKGVVILEGLGAGERVVVSGTSALKALMLAQ
jgi:membrane fusion protein, heavy metal efflux system